MARISAITQTDARETQVSESSIAWDSWSRPGIAPVTATELPGTAICCAYRAARVSWATGSFARVGNARYVTTVVPLSRDDGTRRRVVVSGRANESRGNPGRRS